MAMGAATTMRVAAILVLALALSLACEPDPTTHAGISPVVEHLLPLLELTIFYHLLYEAVDFRGQCHLAGVFPCSRQEAAQIRGLNFQVTTWRPFWVSNHLRRIVGLAISVNMR